MKRFFDIVSSSIGLIVLSPLILFLAIWIKLDSKGPFYYKQTRVGLNNKDFNLYKFRSMEIGSDKKGLITIGSRDYRVTKSGYFLRKYKLDEIPQLINVIIGDMSLVGPRPEVRKYVEIYSSEQLKVLSVRPGITDLASIHYYNENELLATSSEPEEYYINVIMPKKLKINLEYINKKTFWFDVILIFKTIFKIAL